ncbi:hypothetical protein C0J52_17712, partial [Blattella germanica]
MIYRYTSIKSFHDNRKLKVRKISILTFSDFYPLTTGSAGLDRMDETMFSTRARLSSSCSGLGATGGAQGDSCSLFKSAAPGVSAASASSLGLADAGDAMEGSESEAPPPFMLLSASSMSSACCCLDTTPTSLSASSMAAAAAASSSALLTSDVLSMLMSPPFTVSGLPPVSVSLVSPPPALTMPPFFSS